MYSLGQASSKWTFQFFSYLTSNVFSLVDMNNNLPMRPDFINQNEKKESPESKHFFLLQNIGSACVFHKPTAWKLIILK